MAPRGIDGGALREAGEGRRLRQRQPAHALAEEIAAGCLDAVGSVSEVDHVEVHLEDLLLRQGGLETPGQLELDELAPERAFAREMRQEGVSHHLHGDSAETFTKAEVGQVSN